MKPLVYVAGPITKPCPMANAKPAVDLYFDLILDGSVTPVCPHLSILAEIINPGVVSWQKWLSHDFELIENCAAVLRMPGESKGADAEVAHAQECGMPVFREVAALLEWAKVAA